MALKVTLATTAREKFLIVLLFAVVLVFLANVSSYQNEIEEVASHVNSVNKKLAELEHAQNEATQKMSEHEAMENVNNDKMISNEDEKEEQKEEEHKEEEQKEEEQKEEEQKEEEQKEEEQKEEEKEDEKTDEEKLEEERKQLERLKVQEKSKARRTQIPSINEQLLKDRETRAIKLDLEKYTEEELTDIDISKGSKPFHDFTEKLFTVLKETQQKVGHPDRFGIFKNKPLIPRVHVIDTVGTMNETFMYTLLDFEDEFLEDFRTNHYEFVSHLPLETQVNFYNGDGYCILGGGKYTWYSLLVTQVLRELGSELPVEVMIPTDEEYDDLLCDSVLPQFNAKCVKLSTVFGKGLTEELGEMNGYQYKAFAILASSFKNTFLLDADCFPMQNLDTLFKSELYEKFKMLTWPDLTRRTTSPYYYEVAGVAIGLEKIRTLNDVFSPVEKTGKFTSEIPEEYSYHEREGTLVDWTTESGEMLINKDEHFNTLLLAVYYNFNGPTGYHPLLSQGGAGEGDKETFVAAANYFKKPFYQPFKAVDVVRGWYNSDRNKDVSSLIQYDPTVDFEVLMKNIYRMNRNMEKDDFKYDYVFAYRFPWTKANSKQLFNHVHAPKFDPFAIIEEKGHVDEEDNLVRMLGDDLHHMSMDLELSIWQLVVKNICKDKVIPQFFAEKDIEKFCEKDTPPIIEFLTESAKKILETEVNEYANMENLADLMEELKAISLTEDEKDTLKKLVYSRMGVQE